ncbi:SDR family NAD(P)-dependent oxidoreductase [Paraburkholderia tropica]|uniref:SDR family NAD(P)-dependent oxidoreductase n=1 Tax=Paraburkholderia tropica TaxID=92647 RepID=UPI002AB728E9|nr:SDR family oxidoreductase [Paraburkholderia tropica]
MIHPLYDLRGKHALVTGASRGMGLAIARALGQSGASVIIASNDTAEGEAQADALRKADEIDAGFVFVNAGERASVEGMWREALQARGRLDIVVCNAGIAPHMGPLASANDDQWAATMNVNLHGAVWLTNLAAPAMAGHGGGSIILTSSIAGVRGNKAIGVYGISKAALASLARNLAVEWGPQNVRINAISPGMIETEFARPLLDNPEVRERRMRATPLRRPGTPEEIAGVALMLAAPGGAFITGQNVIVDGGTTISDGN